MLNNIPIQLILNETICTVQRSCTSYKFSNTHAISFYTGFTTGMLRGSQINRFGYKVANQLSLFVENSNKQATVHRVLSHYYDHPSIQVFKQILLIK